MSSESESAVKKQESNPPLTTLGKYQIERKLGQGGMGTVYLAKNTDLKKLVALKVLPRDKAKNPILVRRFKAEAQAAGQLEHPNIVAVYDTGEADGYLYIAMEYVDGIDLFEHVKRRGAIPVKRSIEIIKQVASALQHAFEHNIVHRDIKPSNLLLRKDGVVKVTDLGLARSIDETLETDITRAGTTVGTVDYMAPEQARNSKSADIRSDLYSLGCTWYQMLTGDPPFSEGSLTNKLQAHAIKPLPDPRDFNENIPEGLFAVLQRMTAKKPADRYQTPAELLDDLATSKLTNAAFSNEIFSDLSDDEIATVKDEPEEEIEVVQSNPPSSGQQRPRKSRSQPESDAGESTKSRPRRKANSRDEAESDEPSPPKPRRKSPGQAPDTAIDDATSIPSRTKLTKSRVDQSEDDEIDEESFERLSGRKVTKKEVEENEEPTVPKRKRSSTQEEDSNPSSPKSSKGSSIVAGRDKSGIKHAPKPLPPKREPIALEDDQRPRMNLDPLKYIGISAGILALIGGLGWLIFEWGNQVETANNPFVEPVAPPAATVAATVPNSKATDNGQAETNVSVTVIDPVTKITSQTDQIVATEFDIAKQPLPDWASHGLSVPTDLPSITVGPGGTSSTHFSTLDEALKVAGKNGGFVQLVGNGPFQLSNHEISSASKIVIAPATSTDQPLILVTKVPSGEQSSTGLVVSNGMLELRGLHFVLDRSADTAPTLRSIVQVLDGQLLVRNCSFTATGKEAVPASALSFASEQDSQNVPVIEPRVLLDHVTVRGNGLTALRIDRTMCDAVIQNSLFATGTAPSISVSGKLIIGIPDGLNSKPRRLIRILRSTLFGRKEIFELAADFLSKPPSTAIFLQDSICSAEGAGNTTVLASAVNWPSATSATTGWLTNLSWTSQSTLYIGFERLLDLDKSSFKVVGVDAWQRVWAKKFDPQQFQPFIWPETHFSDLSSIHLHDFDSSTLPFRELAGSKGGLPGCVTNQLSLPGTISQTRMIALGQRPRLPATVTKPPAATQTRKVNLAKDDLGAIINKNDWPSGIVFEATGAGIQTMQPARITGKAVRIVFLQSEGAPLKMQLKQSEGKSRADGLGLFTVENGSLDLQSAVLEASSNSKMNPLPWMIHSSNSSVILRGCQLSGPQLQDLPQHQGLIVWRTTTPYTPPPGSDPIHLAVMDSVLMTTGAGIRFQAATGQLFVRNSIIAVRGYGIDLQPIRTGTTLLPVIDLQHATFSASKAAIRIEAASGTETIDTPMRLFIDSCAVVAPLEFKPGEAAESTVVECAGPVLDQKQVEWWGTANGFGKEIKSFLRQSNKEPINTVSNWLNTWGVSNDFRLLTGIKGVQLKSGIPSKWPLLKVGSFQLDPNSAGATWGANGRPVGADVRGVEELLAAKKGTTDTKGGTPATKSSTSPQVGGKKNVGF